MTDSKRPPNARPHAKNTHLRQHGRAPLGPQAQRLKPPIWNLNASATMTAADRKTIVNCYCERRLPTKRTADPPSSAYAGVNTQAVPFEKERANAHRPVCIPCRRGLSNGTTVS